jgi:hypothetical protein
MVVAVGERGRAQGNGDGAGKTAGGCMSGTAEGRRVVGMRERGKERASARKMASATGRRETLMAQRELKKQSGAGESTIGGGERAIRREAIGHRGFRLGPKPYPKAIIIFQNINSTGASLSHRPNLSQMHSLGLGLMA